jgi:hypothetical protein
MASMAIRNDLYRGAWGVVEIDFRSYFTTIPHDKLIFLLADIAQRDFAKRFERGKLSFTGDVLQVISVFGRQ